jgi:Fur family peroxide stress response transcriptional regulator
MQNSRKTDADANIIQALRSKGYKATPQRVAICKIVLGNHGHPSVQKIYHEVKQSYPTVSLATVYTTLRILKETGLIQELTYPQGQTRYDPNIEPHINLICLTCGKIQDVSNPSVKEFITTAAKTSTFIFDAHHIDVFGTCERCLKTAQKP